MSLTQFTSITGTCVPVLGPDMDTDRIIPARFLKCITFDELAGVMFWDERFDENGQSKSHPVDDPRFKGASIILGGEFRLTPIQEALLPHWLETCRNLNNDLAALAFRSRFMDVMAEAKAAITKNLNQALKDEAREASQGTDASDWEARNKDANAAQIETEYLEQRNQALELLISWFGQAALIASGAPEVTPIHPEVRTLAAQMPVNELLKRMEALNRLRDDLNFNIHEALALDVHLLAAVGSC